MASDVQSAPLLVSDGGSDEGDTSHAAPDPDQRPVKDMSESAATERLHDGKDSQIPSSTPAPAAAAADVVVEDDDDDDDTDDSDPHLHHHHPDPSEGHGDEEEEERTDDRTGECRCIPLPHSCPTHTHVLRFDCRACPVPVHSFSCCFVICSSCPLISLNSFPPHTHFAVCVREC